ncbi:MAG: SusE domain-containing protein [Flavobacterium sp.]
MKNISKMFLAALVVTGFASCEDEQDLKFVNPPASFNILTPQNGEAVVLNPENQGNPALTLAWEDANFGTPTEVTYTVQVAANGVADAWASPVEVTSTTNTFASIDVATLNQATEDAGLAPFTQAGLDVRIKATVQGQQETFSNVITYLVTPFSTALPKLAVVGNHQGWSPTAADVPLLASPAYGETNYEGYVWLDGEFKILAPNSAGQFDWASNGGGTEYGAGGAGQIAAGGGNLMAPAPGYYLIRVDTATMNYSLTQTDWGVIGNATPGSWDNSTPMTYNQTTRKWTATVPMVPQTAPDNGWKFRANNAWAINMGDNVTNGTDGVLRYDGSNIGIATAGNYLVTLDLSQPRAYTYTIVQQ